VVAEYRSFKDAWAARDDNRNYATTQAKKDQPLRDITSWRCMADPNISNYYASHGNTWSTSSSGQGRRNTQEDTSDVIRYCVKGSSGVPIAQQPSEILAKILFDAALALHNKTITKTAGSTLTISIQQGVHVITENLGDSRTYIVSRKGRGKSYSLIPMTSDHKPTTPRETKRISKEGGVVQDSRLCNHSPWRRFTVSGGYGYGDSDVNAINRNPDLTLYTLKEEEEAYLLHCCDGVLESMTTHEIEAYINASAQGVNAETAHRLRQKAYRRGSQDNISILIRKLDKNNLDITASYIADGHGLPDTQNLPTGHKVSGIISDKLPGMLAGKICSNINEQQKGSVHINLTILNAGKNRWRPSSDPQLAKLFKLMFKMNTQITTYKNYPGNAIYRARRKAKKNALSATHRTLIPILKVVAIAWHSAQSANNLPQLLQSCVNVIEAGLKNNTVTKGWKMRFFSPRGLIGPSRTKALLMETKKRLNDIAEHYQIDMSSNEASVPQNTHFDRQQG